ncbi:hypothetical protein [Bacillus sp. m3-13]|uniref:hypothetical protein n=1 Tax=Bacillus sp. m3-13 TaxID=406124 RepID=UPI0001E88FB3|nr:hypothetical protein [Bacillus sp. m3-13]
MVNENFDKFNKIQQKHKSHYLGGDENNHRENTRHMDKDVTVDSVGATGRELPLKGE